MSIQIKEVAFIFHSITDVTRARGFYETVLGLKTGFQIEFAPGMWWIEYDIAGVALAVSNGLPGPHTAVSSLAIEVVDLDSALATVRSTDVPISKDMMDFPSCSMFVVTAPDGNEITLHQRKSSS